MHDPSDPHIPTPTGQPGEYGRLRELFDAVLEQTDADRTAWIDAHVADPAEREALLRLLAADAGSGLLETPADERATLIGEDPAAWESGWLGQRVGPFRLTRTLGHGGMAAVFLGEREGVDFHQQVAVKILRRGLFSEAEHALFRRERKALAMLSHPNIAHLIDGGVTRTGIPYLAMEYVDGVSITRHIASQRLALPQRLSLFVVVCHAVAAAHRMLIVHRDIKPSNILVTDAGEVKLLDFGIAKLLDDDDEEATRSGFAALTRGYAAPEQWLGGPISTATDVYALGVLLHEMLLGTRPEEPGLRPSSRFATDAAAGAGLPETATALRGALRGDLDNILLKALAAEPARRYGSASELADDIERHLQGRPVDAHPPSAWYRTRKFVARHRGGVALSVAMALALLASLGLTVWQARVARAQAREAQQQAARAGEIRDFLEGLFQPLQDGAAPDRVPTLRDLLARGATQVAQRYPESPETRADLLAMFARAQDAIGETAVNRELAAAAVDANLAAWGASDARTLAARELHARTLRKLGEYPAALQELEAVRAALHAEQRRGQDYARLLDATSAVGKEQGMDPARVVALQREALAVREADPGATTDDLATGYNNLGSAFFYAGDPASATAWLEKALAVHRSAEGDSFDTAAALQNLGLVEVQAGRWHDAGLRFDEARRMFAAIPIERHPSLVTLLIRQCGLAVDQGNLDAADATCAQAEAMTREVHGTTHRQFAGLLMRRANLRLARGEAEDSRKDFEMAREVARGLASADDRNYVLGMIDAAQAHWWWLHGDYAALRDAMLGLLGPDASPRFGPTQPGRFLHASLAALACSRAPVADCSADRWTGAEALLADPQAMQSALRLPSRIALAECAPSGHEFAARQELARALGEVGPELAPAHAWRVQAHRALASLDTRLGDMAAADSEAALAAEASAAMPPGHSLRRRAH